jgi:hypothetical protein
MMFFPKKRFVPENTWFKVEISFIPAPEGFWDTEIYRVFKANIRKCFKLNPRFLT